jgi:superfamily II DNA or RNA helicase
MSANKIYEPGKLVKVRNREWVIQPSNNPDLIILKPLGGSELETCAIFKPLAFSQDELQEFTFPYPATSDVGDFTTAKILYNASRLSFRNGAGPFRSFGKLSFRPRAFQLVPLILALKQQVVRLLIADDVGVGKTIEAGMIIREMIDRDELKRFAVICPPHLCEQWQKELIDKFNLNAVIIRSGNISSLEKGLRSHQTIYHSYPYQVISVDYIKSGSKRNLFLQECPEMIIVDEAHTCTNAQGQERSIQQQRYKIIHELVKRNDRHVILLTATPHSGLQTQFQSLLGLLNEDFGSDNFDITQKTSLQKLSPHVVMRKRDDVKQFLSEIITFPERKSSELSYELNNEYAKVFEKVLEFARGTIKGQNEGQYKQRIKFWAALGLLRGVMSSPAAGVEMLRKRSLKTESPISESAGDPEQSVNDLDEQSKERLPTDVRSIAEFSRTEEQKLLELSEHLAQLATFEKDCKAGQALIQIKDWLNRKMNPIIFCRFIETANYLGKLLQQELVQEYDDLEIEIITGELHDEQRKEKIEALSTTKRRLVVATDCLSEGINLQDYFNALMHYDLPWNPNRLEQREGRIDRFGQSSPVIEIRLLYGKDNPMDGVVLEVLLRKAEQIRKSVGISVPFAEDSTSIMEAVGAAVLFKNRATAATSKQLTLGYDDEDTIYQIAKRKVEEDYEKLAMKMRQIREIFAQQQLVTKLDIEENLKVSDDALGDTKTVKDFILSSIPVIGGQMAEAKLGYRLQTANLPSYLADILSKPNEVKISFDSPTPAGYYYIGRNHPFVEQLCQHMLANAMQPLTQTKRKVSRAAIFRTSDVKSKTVILLLRIRNILNNKKNGSELLAEEMDVYGYVNNIENKDHLSKEACLALLEHCTDIKDLDPNQQQRFLEMEIAAIGQNRHLLDVVVKEHNERLLREHERYRKALEQDVMKIGSLVPPDIIGVYILFPSLNK